MSAVRPLPGSGLLARAGDLLLVCADAARADELLGLFQEIVTSGLDGAGLVRRLAAVLANDFDASLPACAAAGPASDGRHAVLVYGAATAEISGSEGHVVLTGTDALTSVNRLVAGPVTALTLKLPGAGPVDGRMRLDAGVIAAAGVVMSTVDMPIPAPPVSVDPPAPPPSVVEAPSVEPVAAAVYEPPVAAPAYEPPVAAPAYEPPAFEPPAPRPEPIVVQEIVVEPVVAEPPVYEPSVRTPDPDAPFVAVGLGPGASAAVAVDVPPLAEDARAWVVGVRCDNDHLNDPRLTDCVVCGGPLPQGILAEQEGPRPSLGLLVLDDGSVFGLDGDYVLGREPQHDPDVVSGAARPLRVADSDGIVSRRHARIALAGWDVAIVDLGSANGTSVALPGAAEPRPLAPNERFVIPPGTQVTIGRRWFRYEPNWQG